jgi:hypothetical protein
MTRKIMSFVEVPGVVPPQFNKADNTIIDDVDQLGNIDNKYFFSIDDANCEVVAEEESQLKFYDFSKSEDAAEFKAAANKLVYINIKLDEIEAKLVRSNSLYMLIKNAVEGSEELTSKIQAVESEKEEFLQSLGIPGQSAI